MSKFETFHEKENISSPEKKDLLAIKDNLKELSQEVESFSIEKWKLTHENAQKVQEIIETTEKSSEQNFKREWKSLDEQGEQITTVDKKRTETLIKEIESRFPEFKHFASEQYS